MIDLTDQEQESRRHVLREWVLEHGGHAKVVKARRLTASQASHLSQVINGYSFGPRAARNLERLLGMPPLHLEGLTSRKATYREERVAQALSLPADTIPYPRLLGDEDIMSGRPLPEEFRTTVRDASGGDVYPEGSRILWSTRREPRFGRVVLVSDLHGQLHIRRKQQGRAPGEWIAAPLHPAFATLHSKDDGLTILAVLDGHQLPPDEGDG